MLSNENEPGICYAGVSRIKALSRQGRSMTACRKRRDNSGSNQWLRYSIQLLVRVKNIQLGVSFKEDGGIYESD